ncbi:alpha/beta hydrolase [Angustibacter speluncae]
MTTDIDPRLLAHLAEVMAAQPQGAAAAAAPTPAPAPGQPREEWEAEVAAIRSAYEDAARVMAVHLTPPGPEIGTIEDHVLAVQGGTIGARVFHPTTPGPHPALVFYHGGAWWQAGGEMNRLLTDDYCRVFVDGLDAVVVNVDYRLAPEHPFPHQLEDSYAGLVWTVEHASDLGVDPERVAVMGASSGGNQAAAVCLLARERGGPAIRAQVLHVPALDLTGGSPSLGGDPAWAQLSEMVRLYATDEQRENPLVSPLLAPSLAGLPPAVVVTGDHDPLRDDGRRYVERLTDEGVPAQLLRYPMFHNIALPETTEQMLADMVGAVHPLL